MSHYYITKINVKSVRVESVHIFCHREKIVLLLKSELAVANFFYVCRKESCKHQHYLKNCSADKPIKIYFKRYCLLLTTIKTLKFLTMICKCACECLNLINFK